MSKVIPIMCNTLGIDDVEIATNLYQNLELWPTLSKTVEAEKWLSSWLGLKKGFGFNGGRAALYSIVKALDLGQGDEVILPGLTCQAVANSFSYNGVSTVYADIELRTFSMDVQKFKEKITPSTKAVLLQHSFGIPARDTLEIVDIAKKHNILVIEDVAHGLGGSLHGKKLGTFGDVSFFSSERTKIINTIHGGFAVSSDDEIIKKLDNVNRNAPLPSKEYIKKLLATLIHCYHTKVAPNREQLKEKMDNLYGEDLLPQMTTQELAGEFEPNYECKMDGVVGVLALNQFTKFETFRSLREEAATKWNAWAIAKGFQVATPIPGSICGWVRFPVLVPEEMKKDLSWVEKELGIEPGVWFTSPCHPSQQAIDGVPIGWDVSKKIINLPTGLWVE